MCATLFIAPDPGGPLCDFITLYTGVELTRRMRLGQMRIHLTSIIWIIEHARYELHPVCYNCGANILSFSGNIANSVVYNSAAPRYWSILCLCALFAFVAISVHNYRSGACTGEQKNCLVISRPFQYPGIFHSRYNYTIYFLLDIYPERDKVWKRKREKEREK